MTRRTLDRAHTSREVHQHFEHHPALVSKRSSGRHTVYKGPGGSVPVPTHPGDVARGTLRNIVRLATLAGLAVAVVAVLL